MSDSGRRTPIDVLIVGAGMHVSGRGTATCGTVLPAVVQAHRDGLVGRMAVAATSAASIDAFNEKLTILNQRLGTAARFEGFPVRGRQPRCLAGSPGRARAAGLRHHRGAGRPPRADRDRGHPEAASRARGKAPHADARAEAQALVALAQEMGVYGAVDFHKRWDLMNLKLKETVEDGRLGTPLYCTVEYSQRRVIPETVFRAWVEQANPFQYLCVHFVDILIFALRAVPSRAMAVGQRCRLRSQGIKSYDAVQACVEWSLPGATAPFVSTFAANWIDPNTTSALSYQSLKVIGTEGRFESDQRDRGLEVITEAGGIETLNPYFTQSYPVGDGTRREYRGYGIDSVRTFLEDVRDLHDGRVAPADLEPVRPTLRQALASTAVVDAVNQSLAKDGVWVAIEPLS